MTTRWNVCRILALATACLLGTRGLADTTYVNETFDTYVTGVGGIDQAAFDAVWVPQPAVVNAVLVPGTPTGEPPNDNPPGIQGLGANILGGLNIYGGSTFSLTPTETESIKISVDIFDDARGNKRNTLGLRSVGNGAANLIELGHYNADGVDPTDGVTAVPSGNYAYRLILFGGIGDGIIQQPNWLYFQLDPALDRDNNTTTDTDDITTTADIGQGWHRYSATITPTTVTVTLDLFRDGKTNLTRDENGAIEVGVGADGVDASATWNVTFNQNGPLDQLRFGGPSGITSLHESVLDNILLETITASTGGINADFDGSNLVDGADYLQWQRNFGVNDGTAIHSDGDANGDGNILADDLDAWRTQYGSNPNATAAVAAVPEPAAALMSCGLAVACWALRRRQ